MTRWVLLTLTLLVLPLELRAELSEAEHQADEAFQRGIRLYEAEDYLAAAREFERAYRIVPIQSVHYNIARSYELAEMPERAAQHYRAFIDARAGNPERRSEVRERLDTLSEGLSWVTVDTEPEGAALSLDGEERGVAPLTLAMSPGRHVIEARTDEFSATRTIDVGGEELAITLTLDGSSSEPVTFSSTNRPHQDSTESDYVPPTNNEEPITPPTRSVRRLHHGFFWAGLGLTIGSSIALAVVGTRLVEKRDEYNALPANDPLEEDLREQGQQLEIVTTALWITTGVLVLTTVLFAIFTNWSRLSRNREREDSARPRWAIGLGQGISLAMTF